METSNGSILSRAIPVQQVQDEFLKLTIYGKNRTGKTTLGCCFPKPLLLISFEPSNSGGARSVRKVEGVDMVRVRTTDDAEQLAGELVGDTRYITHVLDTATSLQEVNLEKVLGRAAPVQYTFGNGQVSRDDYRDRSELTKTVLKAYLSLPVNTIVLAQEHDVNKYKDGLDPFFHCDLGDSPAKWLFDMSDDFFQLYLAKEVVQEKRTVPGRNGQKPKESIVIRETGRMIRRLRLMPTDNFAAGTRADDPENVPEYVEARTPAEMYKRLMAIIQGDR